ncbi:MAG: HlyD family type I secretion periplasmic adaptor subunit [Hyphomicrobium sp.]
MSKLFRSLRSTVSLQSESAHGYILAGIVTVAVMTAGMGGWAATTVLAGAVIAPGVVVVETSAKKVQHPTGGIVGEIKVKDGDHVMAGQVVLRLDETTTRANLQIVTTQLDELILREARLRADLDENPSLALPSVLKDRAGEVNVQSLLETERIILAARRATCDGQKKQFSERVAQLSNQVVGVTAQIGAKEGELKYIEKELAGLQELESKQLVTTTRINSLRREAVRLQGEHGQLVAQVAELRGKIAETELQNIGHLQERRAEILKELREVQSKRSELAERKVAADDQLRRIDLRAPQSGIVHELSVHTVGGVVERGEQLMLIVPGGDKLVIEASIAPRDIDQVRPGADVNVRFPSFNMQTTPEFKGTVTHVSADLLKDATTGQSSYVARVTLNEEARRVMTKSALALMPGMPAEVQVQTGSRTVLSYLMKPLEDQLARSFRER